MRKLFVVLLLLCLIGQGFAATDIVVIWYRGSQSAYDIELAKTADPWNDPDNAVGAWNSSQSAYEFTIDLEDFDQYDASSTYKIMENGVAIFEDFMIGDIAMNDSLRTHTDASAGVHGVVGSVVGSSDTQTLTNKTIDGDDNTVQDLHGWSLSAGTSVRGLSVHPDTGEDVYLFMNVASSTGVTIQASDTAKAVDKVLTVIADSVDFHDDGGSDIVLSGISSGLGTNTAVPKSVTDALASRLDILERDDVFNGGASVSLSLSADVRYTAGVYFRMTFPADNDSLQRYEVYWSTYSLDWISAGTTDAEELSTLRRSSNKVIVRYGEGNSLTLNALGRIWVVVVAYDWDNPATIVNSAAESVVVFGGGDDPRRDGDGEVIEVKRTVGNEMLSAAAATDSTASEFTMWTQSDVTPTIKYRCAYRYDSNDVRLNSYFYAQSVAGGYIKIAVMNGSSEVASETYYVDVTSYPSTPQIMDIDVSTGLTAGMLYEVEVSIWSAASHDTNLKSSVVIEAVSMVPIY